MIVKLLVVGIVLTVAAASTLIYVAFNWNGDEPPDMTMLREAFPGAYVSVRTGAESIKVYGSAYAVIVNPPGNNWLFYGYADDFGAAARAAMRSAASGLNAYVEKSENWHSRHKPIDQMSEVTP